MDRLDYVVCVLFSVIFVNASSGLYLHTPNGTILVDTDHTSATSRSDTPRQVLRFGGHEHEPDFFKILYSQGDYMLVGARNVVYNISLDTLRSTGNITWIASEVAKIKCDSIQKTPDECQNYIRVIVRDNNDNLVVCGTNAFTPRCRTYRHQIDGSLFVLDDEKGEGICPFDPTHNSTAIYTDGKLYSGTVADRTAQDTLIYSKPSDTFGTTTLRTEQHDSQLLNEANFVSSFQHQDHAYFMFRETAVEYINCGKAVFSRIGRVCKKDSGGKLILKKKFTSFFKARLNCSIPGDFPFYFDEIQSTTELGRGNVFPSVHSHNNTEMIYGIFSTPENSIQGSAVCAFRFSDVVKSFEGPFKEQINRHSNWLPVSEANVPQPHPAKQCHNNTQHIPHQTLDFVKSHPLMDWAVPAAGGAPIVIQASFKYKFTQIEVDWQVKAADSRYYDIIFIGTSDGRVVKAINKGRQNKIETVIVEDLQVFDDKSPVVNLKVYRNEREEKLIVVSRDEIKAIPLHRCHLHRSCRSCIRIQDPYCSWVDTPSGGHCINSKNGYQNVNDGTHSHCRREQDGVQSSTNAAAPVVPSTPAPLPTTVCPPCEAQTTPSGQGENKQDGEMTQSPRHRTTDYDNRIPNMGPDQTNEYPHVGGNTGAVNQSCEKQISVVTFVLTLILCILVTGVVSCFVGYKIANKNKKDSVCKAINKAQEVKNQTEKPDNRYDIPGHSYVPNNPPPNPQIEFSTQTFADKIPNKSVNLFHNMLDSHEKIPNGMRGDAKGKTYI